MMSAHRHLQTIGDLYQQRWSLERTWNRFLHDPRTGECPIRSVVYESWNRCLQSGVDPHRTSADILLREDEIKRIIQYSQLYDHSFPVLQDLSPLIEHTGYLLTLCDDQGRIIYLHGDREVLRRAERMNFVVGADWSERTIGTNAIGTCLEVGKPVQIFAAEHFCAGVHDWTCSAAPICDPVTGDVLGVIDITGLWNTSQPHTLGTVMMACQTIQSLIYKQAVQYRNRLLDHYYEMVFRYPREGVIALDAAFHPVKCSPMARKIVKAQTGHELESIWDNQKMHASLLSNDLPVQRNELFEVRMEEIGLKGMIKEVTESNRRIGYILLIQEMGQKPSAPFHVQPANRSWEGIIGQTPAIRSAISKCDVVAQTDVPVLLLGESGTGKELFAKAIHRASPRRDGPFVAVNCGAIPRELLASELFGYAPGTFTGGAKGGKKGKFEEANGGTLFLDELGEMPLEFQVHLLRVLQEREIVRLGSSESIPVDVRIIAATHRNLEQLVKEGKFRADLFFRLHVVSINIPPLRERRQDIPLLVSHFLQQLSEKYRLPKPTLDPEVLDFFTHAYAWPGNVRELQNILEHAVLFCRQNFISWDELPETIRPSKESPHDSRNPEHPETENFNERMELFALLQEVNGNLSEAARRLGVARTTLYRRLKKHNIFKEVALK